MAVETVTTGTLVKDPEVHYAHSGTPITSLRIGATRRAKDKSTGRWGDDGAPLYVSAALFGEENTYIADTLKKGDRVTITGTMVIRQWHAGEKEGIDHDLRNCRLCGYIRKADRDGDARSQYQPGQLGQAAADPLIGPSDFDSCPF
jgi:single-stranded DNA-binding protein|nr:MAG TPA: Single strand binding protein [Caudoviricetes sp.]